MEATSARRRADEAEADARRSVAAAQAQAEAEGHTSLMAEIALRKQLDRSQDMLGQSVDVLRGLGDLIDAMPEAQRVVFKAALAERVKPYAATWDARLVSEGVSKDDLSSAVYAGSKVIQRVMAWS